MIVEVLGGIHLLARKLRGDRQPIFRQPLRGVAETPLLPFIGSFMDPFGV
jgi:hypothetical protein